MTESSHRNGLLLIVIVSSIASAAFGQEFKAAGVDPTLADSVTSRIEGLFEPWNNTDSPGCALGIVKDRRLIYRRGFGMANLERNIPITGESVFDVGSMNKQFVAMSILLLAHQGKLNLEDEIQTYLPELPRYQSPITIRHLIHHIGGIRDWVQLAALAGIRVGEMTDSDVLEMIARQKELNFTPGEQHLYSNSEYSLLGFIVERASGKSLREFADENIFEPLGMNGTHFHVDRNSVVEHRATGYYPRSNGGFSVATDVDRHELDTNVDDLLLWDQNFDDNKLGGGTDLLREQLSTGSLNNGGTLDYAFGLWVGEAGGLNWIGHGGYGGGFNSLMVRYPEQHFSVICLCNAEPDGDSPHSGQIYRQVIQIFLADQLKEDPWLDETVSVSPETVSVSSEDPADLAGLYVDPMTERYIHFYMEDGKLMAAWDTGSVLSPVGQDRFEVVGHAGVEIAFMRPATGGSMRVKVMESGTTTTYDAVQTQIVTPGQSEEFGGKYVSDELAGATYTLTVEDGKLLLEALGRRDILVTPASTDLFFIVGLINWYPGEPNHQLTMVRFMRDQKGAVSGFVLTREPEGPRNLRFSKL